MEDKFKKDMDKVKQDIIELIKLLEQEIEPVADEKLLKLLNEEYDKLKKSS